VAHDPDENQTNFARSQADDELRESEERFRATFEQAAVGLAHVGLDGQWLRVNQRLCEIVGYSYSELLTLTFQDITYPDDLETDLEFVRQMMAGTLSTYSMEKRYIRKDGSITWINLTVSLVRAQNGEPRYFISVIEEINRRKQIEAEIQSLNADLELRVTERTEDLKQANDELKREVLERKTSEKKYHALFEDSRDAVFISSPEGKFLDANPASVEMFGYNSKEEFCSIDIARDLYLRSDQREQLQRLLAEYGYVKDFESRLKKKNGEVLDALESTTAVYNEREEIIAYQGIIRDVTRMKELHQQLLHTHKLEMIGRFAGGVAHDFNNLLMAINSYCELMSMKIPQTDSLRKDVAEIQKAVDRAAALTKQLLAFGRKQILSPMVIDLNAILLSMREMIERLVGETIQVDFVLDENLGRLSADAGQMEQVIMNLAVNARDAMPGGGPLIFHTANTELDEPYINHHPYVKTGSYVLLSVTDSGVGMDEETQSHIFEPFFTTKELGKGTGLGLSTVYGIVKQSEGYIEVRSEKAKGTTFEVYLPRVFKPDFHSQPAPTALPSGNTAKTILLVDDNEQIRKSLGAFLENCGYSVLIADSGSEAVRIANGYSETIDLLITDVVMPHMDGQELARSLSLVRPQTKVLFMSGYSADKLKNISGESFLQKPASMRVLLQKVQDLLP